MSKNIVIQLIQVPLSIRENCFPSYIIGAIYYILNRFNNNQARLIKGWA